MLPWIIAFSLLLIGVGFAGNGAWFGATAVAGGGLLGLLALHRRAVVNVPELQVGVVFRRDGQRFARFLPTGGHWINPLLEQPMPFIPVNPGSASAVCREAQTAGGVPVDVAWTLSYTLDPLHIKPEARPKLARTLPTQSAKIATKHVNNVLRHILSTWTVADLYETGAQRRLERMVRQQTAVRLHDLGFDISRVMVDAVTLPPAVRSALEASLQRQLQTEHEARALERLQQVVSRFSEADMQRLMELERIHAMGQHGVALFYAPPAAEARDRASNPKNSYTKFAASKDVIAPGVS